MHVHQAPLPGSAGISPAYVRGRQAAACGLTPASGYPGAPGHEQARLRLNTCAWSSGRAWLTERWARLRTGRPRHVNHALLGAVAIALLNAVVIVQALNLYHALAIDARVQRAVAMAHGAQLVVLEQRLHLAVEPLVQQVVTRGISTPLGSISGAQLHQFLVWLYLHAFPAWLFAALCWSYLFQPQRFGRLRDLTILSALLSVACYRLWPVAPPRMVLAGVVQDWTYGGTSVDPRLMHVLGFNPYAAFPSVHLLWALIPALCLAGGSRNVWVWLLSLTFPLAMFVAVIATGNHYILDCVGSVLILALSAALARLRHGLSRMVHPRPKEQTRYTLPAALTFCLCYAGILACTGTQGGVRVLLAAEILLLVLIASLRSPHLWREHRELPRSRTLLRGSEYLAGVLVVAGATAAAQHPGQLAAPSIRICAVLWFLACVGALLPYLTPCRQMRDREARGLQRGAVARPAFWVSGHSSATGARWST
jgi:hypothetical protein